ncbi:MAG: alpha/beta hydrolase [Aliishimia sp.]
MPDLSLPDVTLHYEISGNGPPMVLIAGFMSDSASWAPLLPLLEPYFTLIRPDNRTSGQTHPWDAPASMELWAQDVISLLDHLGHEKAHIVGHSLGGLIGWVTSIRAPNRVASIMMVGSAPINTPRNTELFRALINIRNSNAPQDTWLRLLFPWLFRKEAFFAPDAITNAVQQSLAYPHAQSAEAMALQLDALQNVDANLFQTPPSVPSRAILSPDDLLVPIDDARMSLNGISLVELTGLGHSIHWDDPQRVAQEIKALTKEITL